MHHYHEHTVKALTLGLRRLHFTPPSEAYINEFMFYITVSNMVTLGWGFNVVPYALLPFDVLDNLFQHTHLAL